MTSRGTKRGATSDDAPDSGGWPAQGKRLMAATGSDAYKTDCSHQPSMAKPPFDEQRLELAHTYVRALNNQFASWVQSQLQDHADELWEGGLQDYLAHASSFLENFSDVVAYLKEKSMKVKDIPTPELPSNQNIVLEGVQGTENSKPDIQLQTKTGFGHDAAASGLSNSWSAGVPFGCQTPVSFGNQASNLFKSGAAKDLDQENELQQPSSPSVKKTEEKGIIVVHEVKCKVYVKPDNPEEKGWKDIGMGMLSIKCKEGADKATKDSRPIVIIRNDVGKILLNASIYPGIKTTIQKNTIASIFHTSSVGDTEEDPDKAEVAVPRTYLLRTKTEEDTKKLAAAIQEYAPAT